MPAPKDPIKYREFIRKISLATKGRKHTKAWKKMMSERFSGVNNPFYGQKHTLITKAKFKNRIISDNQKKKFSIAAIKEWKEGRRKSHQHTKESILKMSGKNNHGWKGDEVGYMALHEWVRKIKGLPEVCEYCKKTGLQSRQINWANISKQYKRREDDCVRLCVRCHRQYDHNLIQI